VAIRDTLTQRFFGIPVWVLALAGAVLVYYLYARGGAGVSGDGADPNAPGDGTGNPLSYPAYQTFNSSNAANYERRIARLRRRLAKKR
jgi:hypothetical protein